MRKDRIAGAIFVLTALIVLGISVLSRASLPTTRMIGKLIGCFIFLLGMVAFLWVLVHLRDAFRGTVAPVTDQLVTTGPYRWTRHPLYLSMIITLVGIAIALRSLWGVVGVFVLFIPAVVNRAKLEERTLAQKFGQTWLSYATGTYFLIPWIKKVAKR